MNLKHTIYPLHLLPANNIAPTPYHQLNEIKHYNSSLHFDDQKNHIKLIAAHASSINSYKLNITSTDTTITSTSGDILIDAHGSIEINCKQLLIKQSDGSLNILENCIRVNAKKITLSTPDVIKESAIARDSDQHTCPLSNGPSNPHIGGHINAHSRGLYINSKNIALHGDLSPCKNTPNQLVSDMNSITLNGKAIAYQGMQTMHQGSVTNGSENIFIGKQSSCEGNSVNETLKANNQLHIELEYFSYPEAQISHLQINFSSSVAIAETTHNAYLTGISEPDIKGIIRIQIS